MDELIAQVDPTTGDIIGEVPKSLAHREGLWHATVHVWILDHRSRLVFQHRSPHKEYYPDLWDISAAGHIRPDEDGLREVAEELGAEVALADLEFICIGTIDAALPNGRNREKPRIYLWRSLRAIDSFTFADGEVTALASVELSDLERLLAGESVPTVLFNGERVYPGSLAGPDLVPLPAEYWSTLLNALGIH